MTRRRWIADAVSGGRATLAGAQAQHMARVLRARIGQEFDIVAEGRVRRGRIISITPDKVEFELGEELPAAALPDITLLLAIFKFDRMEWAIEKATELGVARMVPLIAKRTDVHLAAAAARRVERWRRIAREAAQQSRRLAPPEIALAARLQEVLSFAAERRIVLSEAEEQVSLKQAVAGWKGRSLASLGISARGSDAAQNASTSLGISARGSDAARTPQLALAVGPEGGWTGEEERAFREHGWIAASLGPTILRAETAAIAAVSVALAELA